QHKGPCIQPAQIRATYGLTTKPRRDLAIVLTVHVKARDHHHNRQGANFRDWRLGHYDHAIAGLDRSSVTGIEMPGIKNLSRLLVGDAERFNGRYQAKHGKAW